MAFSLVQHKLFSYGSGITSVSITFTNPAVANNRCIVGTGDATTPTINISSVTDNGSVANSYNADLTNQGSNSIGTNDTRSANIAHNPSSGNLQVTVSFSGTSGGGSLYVQEVSGLGTAANIVDATGSITQLTSTTNHTVTTSGSSSAVNEYMYMLDSAVGNNGSFSGTGGSTVDDTDGAQDTAQGHKASAGGGTETCAFTAGASSQYLATLVVYKLAAAAATTPSPIVYAYSSN